MRRPTAFTASADSPRSRLGIAIEACWLAALVAMPLAYSGRDWFYFPSEPQQYVLHLLALLMAVLWVFERALQNRPRDRPSTDERWFMRPVAWAGRDPARWLVLTAGAIGVITVMSTLLSPLPIVSAFGRDPNEPAYELYSALSVLAIFFAIALRVTTVRQIERIVLAIAVTGALTAVHGTAQHFGWDPVGYAAGVGRVPASFGNPILFGAFLVMSIPLTLAIALRRSLGGDPGETPAPHSPAHPLRRNLWLTCGALAFGIQLAALYFTGSRGPWIGAAVGLLAMAAGAGVLLDRRSMLRGGGMIAAGLVMVLILAALPADSRDDTERGLGSLLPGDGGQVETADGGLLTGRGDIWRGTLELAVSWDRVPGDEGGMKLIRPLFGFGPDMYYYSYPLAAPPQRLLEIASHTHNYPLHILMELGYLGLFAFLALVALAVLAAVRLFRAALIPGRGAYWGGIVLVGVIGALVGRGFEQMSGVARLADLVPFWALLAVLVAMTGIPKGAPGYVYSSPMRRRTLSHMTNRQAAGVFAATMLAVLAVALFTVFDFRSMRASRAAVEANHALARGRTQDAIGGFIRASDLAPLSERYAVNAGTLLLQQAAGETDNTRALALATQAHEMLTSYADSNPYAFSALLRLAATRTFIASHGGAVGAAELLPTLERIVDALPSYPAIIAFVAGEYAAVGLFDRAYETAQLAITMEDVDGERVVPQAWWTVGEVHMRRDEPDAATVAFERAIARDPEGAYAALAHRSIARLLEDAGLADEATEHRIMAEAIEDGLERS